MTAAEFTVWQWSGRPGDSFRRMFTGQAHEAEAELDRLDADMRRGALELRDPDGRVLRRREETGGEACAR